jgi:hypothetical protein
MFKISKIFLLLTTFNFLSAQVLETRLGHLSVQTSTSPFIQADNYSTAANISLETHTLEIACLIKTFEFNIMLANKVVESQYLDVTQHPKIEFTGHFYPQFPVLPLSPGSFFTFPINGTLTIWGMSRSIEATGQLNIDKNGEITGRADFSIQIEKESTEIINELLQQYMPHFFEIDSSTLGIGQVFNISITLPLQIK